VSAPVIHSQSLGRRLARRTLPSLLRYKFLHEYGYDEGAVVVAAIVEDIRTVVRNYYRRPDGLEPGQLIYLCPAADERQRKGKTMAQTRLVPVRLTVVAQDDIDAMVAGVGALERRELRVRRLAHEAYDQGGTLSEADLSLVTGYTDGGVSGPPSCDFANAVRSCRSAATSPTWARGRRTRRRSSPLPRRVDHR
jgi:hypothetical protein